MTNIDIDLLEETLCVLPFYLVKIQLSPLEI